MPWQFSLNTKVYPVKGVSLGSVIAGIKKNKTKDLLAIKLVPNSKTAATFTQNLFCAAPVIIAKHHLEETNQSQILLINAGNANAGTGEQGLEDAKSTCQWVAETFGCTANQTLPFSTGVIGENLPIAKFKKAIPNLKAVMGESSEHWVTASHTIKTTDLVNKIYSNQIDIDGNIITLTGISKGSGMIHPNMATMLAFCASDVKISQQCLQQAITDAVKVSFNRITIDGDTSTNDACTVSATQQVVMDKITDITSNAYLKFANALTEMLTDLAQKIVRDGEGATKFVTIDVIDGNNEQECLKIAHAVALSPLVKTALFASDPNWGRILAAVGRAGVDDLDINSLKIFLGNVCIVSNGGRAKTYIEEDGQAVMNETDINIRIELNRGNTSETVWTTDFSYDYVKINAEYRT